MCTSSAKAPPVQQPAPPPPPASETATILQPTAANKPSTALAAKRRGRAALRLNSNAGVNAQAPGAGINA